MRASTKCQLLKLTAAFFYVAATAFVLFCIFLIRAGAYPPEGSGSLGHVGAVIAGVIAGFLAVTCGLLALFCHSKARAIRTSPPIPRIPT